ncbi:hypothetical protein BBJ28_00024487 [Nothophytophthora sp. Chile5]|nr:hypothetical protein BBJ28_00024487 [Nothophytophthora sp. Chile5]
MLTMETLLRRRVVRALRSVAVSSHAYSTYQTSRLSSTASRALASGSAVSRGQSIGSSRVATFATLAAFGGVLAAAAAIRATDSAALCKEADGEEKAEGGYTVNPIQHVAALLRIYEQIDQNMSVFAARMLEDLEQKVEKEKRENGGQLKLSPEQRALNMSIAFESTLEKVQDAVFRNNYVTKAQVQEALQQLVAGTLRGGGSDGKISVAEAETIDDFVRKLGRLRWKCTGSRDPLIPAARSAWEKPDIEVTTVIRVMEQLIPALTKEMETLATALRKQKLSDAEFRHQLSQQYIKASGKLTEQICAKFELDLRAFQAALLYYHDDELFEQTLARLATHQQKKYGEQSGRCCILWAIAVVYGTLLTVPVLSLHYCRFKELGL